MSQRLWQDRGITIIETTVVLTVLFILAGAMSPIVSESVTTARAVRAKNDAQMIAMALVNLQRDLGALVRSGIGGPDIAANGFVQAMSTAGSAPMPDVLVTAGDAPEIEESASDLATASFFLKADGRGRTNPGGNGGGGRGNREQRMRWVGSVKDSLDDHVTTNRKGYPYRRPGETRGWNGPYLSARIKGDPWGRQYMVNAQWLDGGLTAADSEGRPRKAVFVVSPGANGVIETPYEQPITDAGAAGDDIVIRIQ